MHRKKFDSVLKSVASLFRVLSHPDRIRLAGLLQQGEMGVTQLHEAMGVSQSTVSQHLKLFKMQGLVTERRDGNHIYYQVKSPLLKELIALAIELQTQDMVTQGRTTMVLMKEMKTLWRRQAEKD